MIILNVCERQATALVKGRVTTDSVGLPVEVNLSPEYDGLAVWVCFRAGETAADVALMDGTEVEVPSQCLQVAGEALQVGVWAGDGDGNVRIPTVWASAGTIKQGTERSGIDPAEPEPDWAAQVQQYAQDAHDTAERLAAEVDGWETEIDAAVQGADTATATAQAAASSASSAATSATNAASAASTAAGQASAAAGAATDAASEATGAAASATAAAADATEAAGLADNATAAANAAASNAETATREAITATTGANTAAATANAAAGSATDAASSATTAAGTATDAATSATSAASAAGTAATAANTAATAANAAAEAATEAAEGITDAWLPRVTVGASDGILGGGPLVEGAFVERACPGSDGPARIESIHGNTIVQDGELLPVRMTGVETTGFNQWDEDHLTLKNKSVEGVSNTNMVSCAEYIDALPNMEYEMYADVTGAAQYAYQYDADKNVIGTYASTSTKSLIFTTDSNTRYVRFQWWKRGGLSIDTIKAAKPCLHFVWSGYRNGEYEPHWSEQRIIAAIAENFPDGMRSAGSVRDELRADAAVTRVGAVDLGTLAWRMSDVESVFEVARPSGAKVGYQGQCARYEFIGQATKPGDKQMSSGGSGSYLIAHDSNYTDAAAFKAAMSGIMFFYELATPTTQTIDPPLNLTYKAAQGGTERVMHDEPTAPPTLVVQYGSTADGIRDRALAAIANPDGPKATTNHAVGSYLTMGGTLYKVTTAIASGEAIVPGTNVTATTVMAEVIALIAQ